VNLFVKVLAQYHFQFWHNTTSSFYVTVTSTEFPNFAFICSPISNRAKCSTVYKDCACSVFILLFACFLNCGMRILNGLRCGYECIGE
jgi:hypothetical protein